jgi:hypothetical protein
MSIIRTPQITPQDFVLSTSSYINKKRAAARLLVLPQSLYTVLASANYNTIISFEDKV